MQIGKLAVAELAGLLDLGGGRRQDVDAVGTIHDAGDLLDLSFGGPVERIERLKRSRRLRRGRDDLLGQIDRAHRRPPENIGGRTRHAPAGAVVVDDLDLFGRVGPKLVDGDDRRLAELGGTVEVGGQVFESPFDGRRVGVFQGVELRRRRAS